MNQQLLDVVQTPLLNASSVHHILSGSFRTLSLYLLAFSPLQRTLELVQRIPALGPHQYLTANARRDRVYSTSWAQPPTLSAWAVQSTPSWNVSLVNTVPISACCFCYWDIAGLFLRCGSHSGDVVICLASAAVYSYIFRWWAEWRGALCRRS
jgi:hypothetical protein